MPSILPVVEEPLSMGLNDPHVRLLATRRMRLTDAWTQAEIRSAFWRLYVNDRAGASIEAGGQSGLLRPWRVWLIPAWVRFRGVCRRDGIVHHYAHFDLLGFPPTAVRSVFVRPLATPADPVLIAAAKAWAQTTTDAACATPDATAMCAAKAVVYHALRGVIGALPRQARDELARRLQGRGPVLPALEQIVRNPARPASNAALAALCGVGPDHFVRLFKRCVGQTPQQYALDQRITAAARRLVFTRDTIDRIADDTGFTDRFHFSRVFAARMGTPPAAYRRAGAV